MTMFQRRQKSLKDAVNKKEHKVHNEIKKTDLIIIYYLTNNIRH